MSLRKTLAAARAPEGRQAKRPQIFFEAVRHSAGEAVDAKAFVAIGAVKGFGWDADIEGCTLVEPPEKVGSFEGRFLCLKNLRQSWRLDQVMGLLPEANFAGVAEKPTVSDDAMVLRELAGEKCGLGGASDCGARFNLPNGPVCLGQ